MSRATEEQTRPNAAMAVRDWHAMLARGRASDAGADGGQAPGDAVRRFRDIDSHIEQPALADHVLAVHLGGPKRVTRYRGRHREVFDVAEGSATLMPAHESFGWRTDGPIDFAHLTLSSEHLERIALQDHDLDADKVVLREQVGLTDPLLASLVRSLLSEAERPERSNLYCDSLLSALQCHLLVHYSNRNMRGQPSPAGGRGGGLAGWQLRRVLDHMRANLAEDVRLADLVALTGLSRSQFFHAFGRSTGCSPHRYLTNLRVRQAEALLCDTALPIAKLASTVGLTQPQLGAALRQRTGMSPRTFRRQCGRPPAEA